MKRTACFLLLLAGSLSADVVVLKSGARVAGRVVDKAEHVEVTVDGVLRTFTKEEVERVVTSPKEFVGDAERLVEEARAEYQKALGLAAPAEQNAVLKAAIAKVARAREAYSTALDLFPDDGALGKQIMIVMQLMRLLRERVHLDEARLPGVDPGRTTATTPPVVRIDADDALSTLLDPAKRSDPARRAAAAAAFRAQRAGRPDHYDLATAAMLFLSRGEPEPKASQGYFDKPWLRDAGKLTPAAHLEAARYLATLRLDALQPFALVHLAAAGGDPEVEKVARSLGLQVQNGVVGTPEGHAVRDLGNWIAHDEFDLAVLAFINEYRSVDTPAVRYVWSYALLRLVQARRRGFDRPVSAFETVKTSLSGGAEHLAALSRSIKAAAVCNVCSGEGRFRCTNCHGKKETRFLCPRCKGKGHNMSSLGAKLVCPPCRGTGIDRIVKCEKCKDGYVDCRQCEKPRAAPSMDDIVSTGPCAACEGRGLAFRSAAAACPACLGLGQKLIPKADPAKVLP